MSCIAAPKVEIPDIPLLELLLGDITIDLPDLEANLCCKISLVPPSIPIPIGTILKALLGNPSTGPATEAILVVIDETVDQLNDLLDLLSIDCPLD